MSDKTTELISVKELATKLNSNDALLKKYIRDFEIPTERKKNRIHLTEESIIQLKEVISLKDAGKKNKEIKEIFDTARAAQQVPTEQTPEKILDTEPSTEVSEDTKKEAKEEKSEKPKKVRKSKKQKESETSKDEDSSQAAKEEKSEARTKKEPQKPESPRRKERAKKKDQKDKEKDTVDLTGYLNSEEDTADNRNEIQKAIEADEAGDLDDIEDGEAEEEVEEVKRDSKSGTATVTKKKVRRKSFSYRYIQRQIANDTKRIQYIRNKLQRGRINTLEKINLEESLDKRSKLLSGWMQLLRWTKS